MSIYDKSSLVLIPSGTKTSKVFSQKPVSGDGDFTFTRASAATRVNADGFIEKETQNLLTYSNTFSDSSWYKVNTSVTSGQSGYDGSNNAWLLSKSAVNAQVYNDESGNISTFSIYAKEGTIGGIRLVISTTSTFDTADFNLTDGVLGSVGSVIDAKIEAVGNGWYRCSISGGQVPITRLRIYPVTSSGDGSGTSGNIYIQDAQLEQGLVARDYIETTTSAVYGGITDNVPRLDYTDSSCPALLLEPQRTNELQHSEYVSTWAQNTADITLSDNLSPEGYKNCWRVEGTASGTQVGVATFNRIQGATYTTSIWIRKVSGSDTAIFRDVNNNSTTIDITTEWERHTLTSTTTSTTARLYVMVQNVGDVIEVYGAQLEEGSYATSYIPTYGSGAVTRNVGTAINNNNSNLPTGYPFSLFAEVDVVDTGSGYAITLLTSSNSANYYTIEYFSNTWHITARPNGATTRIPSSPPVTSGTHKVLGIFTDTTLKLYRNGAEIASGSHSQTFNSNIDDLLIGQLRTAGDTGTRNSVRQALVFNQALTDQEAIDLTTI